MRILTLFSLVLLAACSSNYKVSVQPPDCSVESSQLECQEHRYAPLREEIDSEPTF